MNKALPQEKLLQWLVTAGADESIGDTPVNRFAVSEKPSFPPAVSDGQHHSQRNSFPPEKPERQETFVSVPVQADSLEELKNILADCDKCPLKATATNMVFGAGNPQAKLMIIGEAPGAEEDRQGLPFVGASGHLLDLMLKSIGLNRSEVYITNILPWRPPGNRKPSEAEMALLTPFVRRHIALINPHILLLLGGSAVSALMNTNVGITKARGHWMTYSDSSITVPVMASFHPAFLLRTPAQKKLAWRDFLAIKQKLGT